MTDIDTVLFVVFAANYFIMLALWLQAKRHLSKSRKHSDELLATCKEWQGVAKQFENAFNVMQRANKTLEGVIEQYRALQAGPTVVGHVASLNSAKLELDR